MDDHELRRLEEESKKPFKCPLTGCPDYMTETYCHTHVHVRCPQYEHESAVKDFLQRRYEYDDTGMYRGKDE